MAPEPIKNGSHACCFFHHSKELPSLLGPSVDWAISSGRRIIVCTDRMSNPEEDAYLREYLQQVRGVGTPGQVVLSPASDHYGPKGPRRPQAIIQRWMQLRNQSLSDGFAGLLAVGELPWATSDKILLRYEEAVRSIFVDDSFSAICLYDRSRHNPYLLFQVLRIHPEVLIDQGCVQNPLCTDVRGIPWEQFWQLALEKDLEFVLRRSGMCGDEGPAPKRSDSLLDPLESKLASLSILAEGVAHVFRNLCMGINGQADLAKEKLAPDAPAREALAQIQSAVDHASEFADRLLAIAGGVVAVTEVTDLRAHLSQILDRWEPGLPKGTRLSRGIQPGIPLAILDSRRLEMLIDHLIANAVEACPPGGSVLSVTARTEDGPAPTLEHFLGSLPPRSMPHLVLTITDQGQGIPKEHQARLFDPFFSTKSPGRGFGLPVALGLARLLGGGLAIDSREGAGTRVTVILPLIAP